LFSSCFQPGQPFLVEKELAEKYGRVFGYVTVLHISQ